MRDRVTLEAVGIGGHLLPKCRASICNRQSDEFPDEQFRMRVDDAYISSL